MQKDMKSLDVYQICLVNDEHRYGFNIKKYPSMVKTITEITKKSNLSAVQVFIANNRSKNPPKFDYDDLAIARKLIKMNNLYIVIHGCYLYNLAGTTIGKDDGAKYHSSLATTLQGLTAELDYGVMLGCGVIIHPGSCKNKKEGLESISNSIKEVLTRKTPEIIKIAQVLNITPEEAIKRRIVILENAAGEGTKLCATLEEINTVIIGVPKNLRKNVKVCIDTAHAFGRGLYDWGVKGEIRKFYKDFDKIVGLQYLEVFHFNDSDENKKIRCSFWLL
jgi:endonuclease IV